MSKKFGKYFPFGRQIVWEWDIPCQLLFISWKRAAVKCLFSQRNPPTKFVMCGVLQLDLRSTKKRFICSWMIRKLIKNLEISWSVTECKEKVFQIYDGQQSASHSVFEITRLSAWSDQRVAWKLSGILVGTPNYIRHFSSFHLSVASSN